MAIAGIAAGLAALGAGIYTGVTTGSWEEGLKAGATVGLAVGVGVATVGLATAGSVTVGAGVVVKGVLASTQVVTAAGSGTGAILATSAMAGTATYKAGQRFIQRKNVGLGEAVNSVASAGYAGYNIGNAISLGSTYINSKTGVIDSWISSLDSAINTNNTYHYGDINENAGYVNPDGAGGRLGQEMAGATANSGVQACKKAEINYENQSKGSTGRMEPYNLLEKLSMEQVKADPLNGATKLDQIRMTDPRWLAEDGWVKMQNVVKHSDGTSTNIHFVFNEISGAFDDFKFK